MNVNDQNKGDQLVWSHTSHGNCTVKNGYIRVASNVESNGIGDNIGGKSSSAHLKVGYSTPNKLKQFHTEVYV